MHDSPPRCLPDKPSPHGGRHTWQSEPSRPHCWRRPRRCGLDLLLQTRRLSRQLQSSLPAEPTRLIKSFEGSAGRDVSALGSQGRDMTITAEPINQSESASAAPVFESSSRAATGFSSVAPAATPLISPFAVTASIITTAPGTDAAHIDTPGPVGRYSQGSWFKYVVPLAGVALIGILGLSQRHLLGESASVLRTVHWPWIALALACEAGSITTFGLAQRRLLNVGGVRIGIRPATAITLVGKAISSSLPLAGPEMGTAYTYRQFQRHRADGVTAAWVLTVSGVASTVSFAIIVSAAAIATDNLGAILAGLATTILTVFSVAVAVVAFRRPAVLATIERAVSRGLQLSQRIVHRPRRQSDKVVKEAIAQLSSFRVNRLDMSYVALTSSANWIGDILCLALAIAAFEKSLPWVAVVLAWTAGSVATSLQLTPGGLGVVEAALTSALVLAGLHPGDAAAVALTYRAMSYWAPTLTGWAVLGAQYQTPLASSKRRSETAHSRDDPDSGLSEAELVSSTHPRYARTDR